MVQSLAGQKVAAYVSLAQKNEHVWGSILVFLAVLTLLSAIPFFPIIVIAAVAALCGIVSYKNPSLGIIIGTIVALPAVVYQSAILGWIYLLVLVAVFFQAFEDWMLICVLYILILTPFAFGGLPLAGWISIVGMICAGLYFGSKKSLIIAIPSVLTILLLSSMFLVQNTAYLPINLELYKPGKTELQMTKPIVDIGSIGNEISHSLGAFLSLENLGKIVGSFVLIGNNILILLLRDSALLQLISWAAALFAISYFSARIKQRPQLTASLILLTINIPYFLITYIYKASFRIEFVFGTIFGVVVLGALEHFGIIISKESELQRKDQMKSYGKFGMSDMSLSGDEKSMDDIGGYEDVKEELRDAIITPLEKKEIAYAYNIKPPAGILLFGPPGTGKTMLMRALAKELKYNFIEVRCSQILSQWYGESEKNVAEVFANARKNAPTVLFFDEMDSIGKKRNAASLDEVGPRVLSTLLQEMDGASKSKSTVMVVGATNLPGELDPALMRPGRFDKIIYMHLPDPPARLEILKASLKRVPMVEGIDLTQIVKKTERFSGADMKNIVVEAKRIAAKEATKSGTVIPISMDHLLSVVSYMKPSTSLASLENYEQFRLDFERRIGGQTSIKKEETQKEGSVKWADVAGLDDVKEALLETIELPLLHEQEMKEFKVKPSKGILLFGPPGTGKTLIVKAASNELKASFQSLSAAEIMNKGYTQAANVIKETFNRARENAPAIIFVDEIETFAPSRSMVGSAEILGQFLTEMDGVRGLKGVVVIGATNKPSIMDPAIMRPGRFDKIFYIPPADEKGREEMFKIHLGDFASLVDLKALAKITSGFSGADIASICQSVKMSALKARIAGSKDGINTEKMITVIQSRRPSITREILVEYEQFLKAYGERK